MVDNSRWKGRSVNLRKPTSESLPIWFGSLRFLQWSNWHANSCLTNDNGYEMPKKNRLGLFLGSQRKVGNEQSCLVNFRPQQNGRLMLLLIEASYSSDRRARIIGRSYKKLESERYVCIE